MSHETPEDPLLKAAAHLLDPSSRDVDPRLEALACGALTPEDEAALTADAEQDPALARDVMLHAPMSSEARGRLFEAARAGRARPSRGWLAGAAVALAAGIGGLVALQGRPGGPEPAPLPEFAISIRAEQAEFRGSEAAETRAVRADTEVSIALTPSRTVADRPVARLYRLDASGAVPLAAVEPEWSADNAVRWLAPAAQLAQVQEGKVRLVAVVSWPEAHPPLETLDVAPARGPGWQSVGVELTITPVGSL